MLSRPDLSVQSAEGQLRLLVEIKTRGGVYENESLWPVELRRQFGHFDCYFLLVTPERMLLFPPGDPASEGHLFARESAAVLSGHLSVERFPLASLGGLELTAVVRSWLGSVIFKPQPTLLADPAQAWLVESGLHAQIYRGYINREQAAA